MKKLFTIAIILFALPANAQNWPIDKETNKIMFTEVVTVDSATKNELYLRAREWFAKTYNNSKDVIQMDDKEAGKIVGKGAFKVYAHNMGLRDYGLVTYTISITAKDGRFKYELTDIYHTANGGFAGSAAGGAIDNEKPACGNSWISQKAWSEIKLNCYDKCTSLIETIKPYMKLKNEGAKENW